jgi:electron transport complex protein RnfA
MELFIILFSSILINNFLLSRFLGICPFIGVSRQVETATGMGMAVIFVMSLASILTWMAQHLILIPLGLEYLNIVVFILIIASLVQLVEMVVQKISPTLYQALGVYLPLITTNCAVLGVALINVQNGYNFIESLISGVGGGVGFALVIIIFAGIRERIEHAPIPEAMKGFPIALVTAGLMSIAFQGFIGFDLPRLFGLG